MLLNELLNSEKEKESKLLKSSDSFNQSINCGLSEKEIDVIKQFRSLDSASRAEISKMVYSSFFSIKDILKRITETA